MSAATDISEEMAIYLERNMMLQIPTGLPGACRLDARRVVETGITPLIAPASPTAKPGSGKWRRHGACTARLLRESDRSAGR